MRARPARTLVPRRAAWLLAGLAACSGACDASVVEGSRIPLGDARVSGDGSAADLAPATDGAHPDAAASSGSDAAASGVFARGPFSGRTGHVGRGRAELVRVGSKVELRFSSDFAASTVPGPVVVLTRRASIGSTISTARGDLSLGTLQAASGAQSYVVSGGDGGRRYAWDYCKPFGVEIARAKLEDLP